MIVFAGREREDLQGVFKDCSEANYEAIESGIIFDIYSPQQIKEALQKYNLQYAGVHGGFANFEGEKELEELIQKTLAVGAANLICSGVAVGSEGLSGYRAAALVFNRVGKRCKDAGITFCYHNHAFEFEEFEGIRGIDLLGKETDPQLVKFNIDVAWVYVGGEAPSEFIERYKDRAGYYHFKDVIIKDKEITFVELGKGEVPLKLAYETALKYNPKYIIYEQDRTQLPVRQAISESREYLKKLGI